MPTIQPIDLSPITGVLGRLMDQQQQQFAYKQQTDLLLGQSAMSQVHSGIINSFDKDPSIDPLTYEQNYNSAMLDNAKTISKDWSAQAQERFMAQTQQQIAQAKPGLLQMQGVGLLREANNKYFNLMNSAHDTATKIGVINQKYLDPTIRMSLQNDEATISKNKMAEIYQIVDGNFVQTSFDGMSSETVTATVKAPRMGGEQKVPGINDYVVSQTTIPTPAMSFAKSEKMSFQALSDNFPGMVDVNGNINPSAPEDVKALVNGFKTKVKTFENTFYNDHVSPATLSGIQQQVWSYQASNPNDAIGMVSIANQLLKELDSGRYDSQQNPLYLSQTNGDPTNKVDSTSDKDKAYKFLSSVVAGTKPARDDQRINSFSYQLRTEQDKTKRVALIEKESGPGGVLFGVDAAKVDDLVGRASDDYYTPKEKALESQIKAGVSSIEGIFNAQMPSLDVGTEPKTTDTQAHLEWQKKKDLAISARVKMEHDKAIAVAIFQSKMDSAGQGLFAMKGMTESDIAPYVTSLALGETRSTLGESDPLKMLVNGKFIPFNLSPGTPSTLGSALLMYQSGIAAMNPNDKETPIIFQAMEKQLSPAINSILNTYEPGGQFVTDTLDNINPDGKPTLFYTWSGNVVGKDKSKAGVIEVIANNDGSINFFKYDTKDGVIDPSTKMSVSPKFGTAYSYGSTSTTDFQTATRSDQTKSEVIRASENLKNTADFEQKISTLEKESIGLSKTFEIAKSNKDRESMKRLQKQYEDKLDELNKAREDFRKYSLSSTK